MPHLNLEVSPVPQSMEIREGGFAFTPVIWIVTSGSSSSALLEVEKALYHAGVREIEVRSSLGNTDKSLTAAIIFLGEPDQDESISLALEQHHVQWPHDLKAEGYVVASGTTSKGTNQIILAGKDPQGTFYATQTFRQLIKKDNEMGWMPYVAVHDWPSMTFRGAIEGFYGPPWSHEDRLSQLAFYGEHKMNTYIYAPKDDLYHREKWRDPYPEEKMQELKELVDAAKRKYITFTFAISPGNTIGYSNDSDFHALVTKAQALWDIGVRSYALYLDDIDPELRSIEDQKKFGGDQHPPAAAQAFLLNRFNEEFIQKQKGALPLVTVPTEYSEEGTSPYRERFADLVHPDIIVQWTGIGIVAPTISSRDARFIHSIFKHPLFVWDNYPVNDIDRNRLFLAPLTGRDRELCKEESIIGITANPMNEAESSKIPLFTIADYMWNALQYDPKDSIKRSISEFGGEAAESLHVFVESNFATALNQNEEPLSNQLQSLMDQFWDAYENGDLQSKADALLKPLASMANAPAQIQKSVNNPNFLKETAPYLDKLELYGTAGALAVKMLLSVKDQRESDVVNEKERLDSLMSKLASIPQKLSIQALDPFILRALSVAAPTTTKNQ